MLSKIKSTLLSRSDGHILDLIYLTGWDTVDFVNPGRDFNHIYTKIPIIRYFSDFSSNVSKFTHTCILIHTLICSYTHLYTHRTLIGSFTHFFTHAYSYTFLHTLIYSYTLLYVLYTFWYVLYLHTLLYVLTLIYILIHALMFFDTYTLYSLHTRLHTLIYLYHTLICSYHTYILIETD